MHSHHIVLARVYLAVAGLGVVLNILFLWAYAFQLAIDAHYDNSFCHLPEITEDALENEMTDTLGITVDDPFYKQYRCIFGFVAQMAYV